VSPTELRCVIVTFGPDGGCTYAVTYAHDAGEESGSGPGTKQRTARAARMARKGLEHALEGLASPRTSASRRTPSSQMRRREKGGAEFLHSIIAIVDTYKKGGN
jgi:hypothetical protein